MDTGVTSTMQVDSLDYVSSALDDIRKYLIENKPVKAFRAYQRANRVLDRIRENGS